MVDGVVVDVALLGLAVVVPLTEAVALAAARRMTDLVKRPVKSQIPVLPATPSQVAEMLVFGFGSAHQL